MGEAVMKKRSSSAKETRSARRTALEFNHAMIYTKNLERSLDFYQKILGFELIDAYPGAYARLRSPVGLTTIALHRIEPDQRVNAATGGIRLYFEVKGLDAFCRTLEKKNVQLDQKPVQMPWGWRHAYLRDPDGHEISLYKAGKARLKRRKVPT
jgi:catechol 2,3-dioxygenase-like lactoylglutathione lyase family enzyme